MEIIKQQLDSFIDLYEQEFGVVLDSDEAQIQASALLRLVDLTYRPMKKKEYNKYYLPE